VAVRDRIAALVVLLLHQAPGVVYELVIGAARCAGVVRRIDARPVTRGVVLELVDDRRGAVRLVGGLPETVHRVVLVLDLVSRRVDLERLVVVRIVMVVAVEQTVAVCRAGPAAVAEERRMKGRDPVEVAAGARRRSRGRVV